MKKFALLLAPALLVGLAAGAEAQMRNTYQQPRDWRMTNTLNSDIRRDIASLRNDINRAESRRTISRREADRLRVYVRETQTTYARYNRNGLNWAEVRDLEMRVNRVRAALRYERRDWDGRPV
jgi:type II secretory pathway component PulJ